MQDRMIYSKTVAYAFFGLDEPKFLGETFIKSATLKDSF